MHEDETTDRAHEQRIRRMARREGLALVKSRTRDPRAMDYGTYALVDPYTNALVAYDGITGYGLDLDHIERELTESPTDANA